MQTYKDFRPTTFDSHISLEGKEQWLVLPCTRNRESECLEESNFHTALQLLGGESETVEVHRFGHWACGWFEIIIVQPHTFQAAVAQQLESKLEDYPILDEDDLSEREAQGEEY